MWSGEIVDAVAKHGLRFEEWIAVLWEGARWSSLHDEECFEIKS